MIGQGRLHYQQAYLYGLAPSGSARRLARVDALTLALFWLFGFLLPIMKMIEVTGVKVNFSAADLLVAPMLIATRRHWTRSGTLGYWLFALWMVNLLAWTMSLNTLTFIVFLRECSKIATCYIYALIGFGIGREARTRDAYVRGLIYSAIPIAMVSIIVFFTRKPAYFFDGARVAGTFGDANGLGIYLGMLTPLMGFVRFAWIMLPLFIAATVVTFSRTGLVALGSAVTLNLIRLKLRQALTAMVACAILGAVMYSATLNTTKIGHRLTDYQGSLQGRQGLWHLAMRVTADHPFFGIGRGNWFEVSSSTALPHNTFLSVTVDNGFIGLVVFFTPLLIWLWRGARDRTTRPWAIALLVGLVGGLAVSLDNFRPFWLTVGVLLAQLPRAGRRYPHPQQAEGGRTPSRDLGS